MLCAIGSGECRRTVTSIVSVRRTVDRSLLHTDRMCDWHLRSIREHIAVIPALGMEVQRYVTRHAA